MDFGNLDNSVAGLDNMGGTATVLLYGRTDDVETFPALPDASTATLETGAVLAADDIVMKTGKQMFRLYSTQDMAEVAWDEQGPVDGKSVMGKLSISHPGIKAKIASFVRASNNDNFFFIVPNNDGGHYLLGTPKLPAKRAGGKATTGKATGDGKVTELTFQAPSVCPIVLTVLDADITRLTAPAVAP